MPLLAVPYLREGEHYLVPDGRGNLACECGCGRAYYPAHTYAQRWPLTIQWLALNEAYERERQQAEIGRMFRPADIEWAYDDIQIDVVEE